MITKTKQKIIHGIPLLQWDRDLACSGRVVDFIMNKQAGWYFSCGVFDDHIKAAPMRSAKTIGEEHLKLYENERSLPLLNKKEKL